ncbi:MULTISPECIES: alpha/beta fold hydrolase [Hyphomicrobiales]|jgi:pimeloyl-ACP methyl ester carboxylesterase|uniref:Alpha/beta fold hydrolase n=1 Tax=Bosea massiliensis TaxID=151419 RepID=A0ABW0PAS6_9HYPH|nr:MULTISPECIES: alpha/beta hydrolase [Hyphomicrobiales]
MTRELHWSWEGQTIPLGLDEAGEGPSALLLPALSSISTRSEMHPLMQRLAPDHHVMTVDWPGFGDRPRPKLDYTPAMLQAFLDWLLTEIVPRPALLVAAGHASAYALGHLARHPGTVGRLVLVAPTWRGPFPTMMEGERPWFARVRAAVDAPVLGPALYALNLSGPVIRKMVVGHVYSDPTWLTPERMAAKRAVTSAAGARHASVRFVTGGLDRVASRDAFLALAEKAAVPTLVVYGAETPPKSRAEMEALAARPGIESVRLPQGKLSLHEEFPDAVAEAIARFAPG